MCSGDAGADSLLDLSGTNTLLGGDGNDTIHAGMGNATIGGGAGVDTLVLDLPRRLLDLAFSPGAPNAGLVSGTGVTYAAAALQGTLTYRQDIRKLSGIEALHFADGRLVFDPGDPIGQVTRMYFAALGRAGPDRAERLGQLCRGRPFDHRPGPVLRRQRQFQARCPGGGSSGFVTLLYENTLVARRPGRLHRPGSAPWTAACRAPPCSPPSAMRGTTTTPPRSGQRHLGYRQTAPRWHRLYHAALGRAPECAGWQGWTSR